MFGLHAAHQPTLTGKTPAAGALAPPTAPMEYTEGMADTLSDAKLLEILKRQGYRELVSTHLFAGGVRAAPSVDDKHMLIEHAGEELVHFELISALYEEVSGRNLYDAVAEQAQSMPVPASWPEVVVAAYLVDHAAALQLAAYQQVADARLERVIRKIREHEHEHKTATETALLDLCQSAPERKQLALGHVGTWYPRARAVLDEDSGPVEKFASNVRALLGRCGLELPSG